MVAEEKMIHRIRHSHSMPMTTPTSTSNAPIAVQTPVVDVKGVDPEFDDYDMFEKMPDTDRYDIPIEPENFNWGHGYDDDDFEGELGDETCKSSTTAFFQSFEGVTEY